MPSLDKLGTELIIHVLLILQETCPSSLEDVSYTSRRLYSLAQILRYSMLPLTFSKRLANSEERLLKYVFSSTRICESIREILIHYCPSELSHTAHAARRSFDLLINSLPRLRGLKHVSYKVDTSFSMKGLTYEESSWDDDFGLLPSLLSALHIHHPRCRLSISLPIRIDLVSVLSQLASSSCLHSLIVDIHADQHLACGELFRIVPTCPNLRTLKILSSDLGATYKLAHPKQGDAIMRLDSLELDGPIFSPGEDEYDYAKEETSPFEFLDLPSLRRLSLTYPRHLIGLPSTVLNLRYLRIDLETSQISEHDNIGKALLPSIFADQRLEELYLTGCIDIFTIDSMKPLKDTLKCLKVHENEDKFAICRRQVFSDQEIQDLGELFPNLEYLSLDINYDGQWPLKTLSTISHSFPSLIQQELNLEINISNPSRCLHPAATLTSSVDIWNHIWKETSAIRFALPHLISQPRLRALDINAGSFRQTQGKRPLGINERDQYEQREQQTFRVRRKEHEEKAKKGIAEVTCAQVQDMEKNIGIGPVSMRVQLRLLEEARERAETGVKASRDQRLHRNGPSVLDVPDNNFELLWQMESLMAPFEKEWLWLSRKS